MTSKHGAAFTQGTAFGVVLGVAGGLALFDAGVVALVLLSIAYLFEKETEK